MSEQPSVGPTPVSEEGPPRLLPCPFCGGEAKLGRDEDESLWSHAVVWWSSARCPDCGVRLSECDDPTMARVAEAWNDRPSSSSDDTAAPTDTEMLNWIQAQRDAISTPEYPWVFDVERNGQVNCYMPDFVEGHETDLRAAIRKTMQLPSMFAQSAQSAVASPEREERSRGGDRA